MIRKSRNTIQTTLAFELAVGPHINISYIRGQAVEGLTMRGLDVAQEFLQAAHAKKFPNSKPGPLLRAKTLPTLRAFAYSLREEVA